VISAARCPEWKWNLDLSYARAGLRVDADWRFIDGMRDADQDYSVPHIDYFDLYASYDFGPGRLAGLSLRCGVENLTDEDPPLLATPIAANTDPSLYDVLGRRYYVGLSYKL